MTIKRLTSILSLMAIITIMPGMALAADIIIGNPLNYDTFEELVDAVIKMIFWISLALAPLMILIGAFQLLTSAGNPAKVKTAQNIFLWTAVGLLVVFMARGLIALINVAVTG